MPLICTYASHDDAIITFAVRGKIDNAIITFAVRGDFLTFVDTIKTNF